MNKKVSIDFYGHENSLQMDLYKTSRGKLFQCYIRLTLQNKKRRKNSPYFNNIKTSCSLKYATISLRKSNNTLS